MTYGYIILEWCHQLQQFQPIKSEYPWWFSKTSAEQRITQLEINNEINHQNGKYKLGKVIS